MKITSDFFTYRDALLTIRSLLKSGKKGISKMIAFVDDLIEKENAK